MMNQLQQEIESIKKELKSIRETLNKLQQNPPTPAAAAPKPQKEVDPNNLDFRQAILDGEYEYAYRIIREIQRQLKTKDKIDVKGEEIDEFNLDRKYRELFEAWCPIIFSESDKVEIDQFIQKLSALKSLFYFRSISEAVLSIALQYQLDRATCLKIANGTVEGNRDLYKSLFDQFYREELESAYEAKNENQVKNILNGIKKRLGNTRVICGTLTDMVIQYDWDKEAISRTFDKDSLDGDRIYDKYYSQDMKKSFETKEEQNVMATISAMQSEMGLIGISRLIDQAIFYEMENVAGYLLAQYNSYDKSAVARKVYAKFPDLKKKKK